MIQLWKPSPRSIFEILVYIQTNKKTITWHCRVEGSMANKRSTISCSLLAESTFGRRWTSSSSGDFVRTRSRNKEASNLGGQTLQLLINFLTHILINSNVIVMVYVILIIYVTF